MNLLLLLSLFATPVFGFEYFRSDIDYWRRQNTQKNHVIPEAQDQHLRFNWQKHMNPNNKEFFREGDYLPPDPFMELIRHPTDRNIKNWLAMVDLKNQLSQRLQTRLAEYIAKQPGASPAAKVSFPKDTPLPVSQRYILRMYFSPGCPHCLRMLPVLERLRDDGYFVELRKVGNTPVKMPLPFAYSQASEEELQRKHIVATPVLLIGDRTRNHVLRLNGFHNKESILKAINNKEYQ